MIEETETQVLLSPTKVVAWSACDHFLTLEILEQQKTLASNQPSQKPNEKVAGQRGSEHPMEQMSQKWSQKRGSAYRRRRAKRRTKRIKEVADHRGSAKSKRNGLSRVRKSWPPFRKRSARKEPEGVDETANQYGGMQTQGPRFRKAIRSPKKWLVRKKNRSDGRKRPPMPKGFQEMLQQKGYFHEDACLQAYIAVYGADKVLVVPDQQDDETWEEWIHRIDEDKPWNGKYKVIFQMPFLHEGMRGVADFLIKRETTNSKGEADFFYEPIDSKLARNNASKSHLLQLLFYAEALEKRSERKRAEEVHVALGKAISHGKEPELDSFEVANFWWYWMRKKTQLKEIISLSNEERMHRTEAKRCSYCSFCKFFEDCSTEWGKDSLIHLAGSLELHRDVLESAGINTIAKLALLPKDAIGENIRDFDDETKQAFEDIELKLVRKSQVASADDLLDSWSNRDQLEDMEPAQLQKLWRQARLQSIRKENAKCPDCHTDEVLSEDDVRCPQCQLNLTKSRPYLEPPQFAPLHQQALAPIFLFNEQEIEEKVLKHHSTMSDFQKRMQPEKVQESLLGLDEQTLYDVYLDFEGHPFWNIEEGIIFLFGYIKKNTSGWEYVDIWSHDELGVPSKDDEKKAAVQLINELYTRWQQSGRRMRIYHYNHTERTLLKDLTNEADPNLNIQSILQIISGSEALESQSEVGAKLNEMVRKGAFVDLLNVVRNSMQVGYESMSLKYMEKLTGFERTGIDDDVQEGLGSMITAGAGAVFHYELYANHKLYSDENPDTDDQRKMRLKLIANYNRDDVEATRSLHEWLLQQRKLSPHLPDYQRRVQPEPPRESNGTHIMLQQRLVEYFRNLSNAN